MRAPWQAEADEILPASSKPMLGGLGRRGRLHSAIAVLHPLDRRMLLTALDELSRPMNAREIEEALLATGLARTDRKRLVKALKDFPIIMVAPA